MEEENTAINVFDLHVSKISGYSAQFAKGIKGDYVTYLLQGMNSLFGNCKINLLECLQYTKDRFFDTGMYVTLLARGHMLFFFWKSMDIASVIFGRTGAILGRTTPKTSTNASTVH